MSKYFIAMITLIILINGCDNKQSMSQDINNRLNELESCTIKQENWVIKFEELNNNRDQIKNMSQEDKNSLKQQLTDDQDEYDAALNKIKDFNPNNFSQEQLQRFNSLADRAHLATQNMREVLNKIRNNNGSPE